MATITGDTGEWEVVIGLEVHAQIVSDAKLFSGAATAFGADQNTQVSLVDAAMPGMLPVVNRRCIEQAVRTGLGLKARINRHSVFARKNYFYPDLPAGYQISQYDQPIVGEGEVLLDMPDGETRRIGIERLHMEQDAGKSIHDQSPNETYVDLNRAGVALMEIVSKPDLRGPEEVAVYLTKIRSILRYLGTCDGNMEQGSLRCDVNVSVRRPGEDLGTRCEIKNVNSIRFVRQAIDYEAARQVQVIEDGGEIAQETRLFDANKGETRSMRSKEEAHDYRYFPDPDLLPIELDEAFIEEIRAGLPELPDDKKRRFIDEYGMTPYNAAVLVADRETADYFEETLKNVRSQHPNMPKQMLASDTVNLIINLLFGRLNKENMGITDSPVSPAALAELQSLQLEATISGRIAKDVFDAMFETGKPAGEIVAEKGLRQITDTGEIEAVIDAIVADAPEQAEQFRAGNEKVMGWFVGQAMKATQGKANPKLVNEILRKKLAG